MASDVSHKTTRVEDASWIEAVLDLAHQGKGSPIRAPHIDAASQSAEFIGYNRSIVLTAAQRRVRDKALSAIPAACCSKFSAATCCCPCNLAKSVWGLSNVMIARERATVAEVQAAARQWLTFVNGRGFTGDVCDTPGGCGRNFSNNGCGGMDERNLLAAR